ncbi:hypothetical protein MMC31_001593 [Peltigera leucophlebia]|nr:hypothetical protein [Peltigera leucophlebia]
MKTRQQRLAEERAGHPSSPPQQLADKTRGPRRTRAKKPSVGEAKASSPAPVAGSGLNPGCVPHPVAAGSVVPAAQLAMPGDSQALLRVWVDAGPEALASGRPVNDPNLELAIPSALVPELLAFIGSRNQAQPQIQETSQVAAPITPARIDPALQQSSDPVKSHSTNQLPLPKKLESQPAPLTPETLTAAEIPAIFRKKSHLPFYAADGTAFYGKLPTTTKALGLNASSENHEVSQQLDDEASANEDSEMVDINESGSITSPMAETPLREATQSTQESTPETPRGSGWSLGSFFKSAHDSARRRFGFSPLTPVSERSEPTPQTQTTKMAQMQTETIAPTKPKEKKSVLASAKATRARNRRHNGSVAESVKPITSGPNHRDQQLSARATRSRLPRHNDSVVERVKPINFGPNHRDQQPRAKQANLASGPTEAIATEEENSPAMRPTHRDKEEARKAQSGESDMTPTIRFPSRTLDKSKMASKRKRWGSPDTIPNPDASSYGLCEAEFDGNSKYDEDDVTEQQPGKLRRTSQSEDFSSQVVGDPHKARPYTGRMFKKFTTEYAGGNVFSEYEAGHKAEEATAIVTNSVQQSLAKTPIPITNSSGKFKVPSPGDSDWSSSESEEEVVCTTGLEGVTPTRRNDGGLEVAVPTLSPSKLPRTQHITKPAAESEALRKVRDKALKHKPRNPSTLSQSSRNYSSPPAPNEGETKPESGPQAAEEAITVSNPEPAGRPNFTAYEEWRKTAPSAVAATVERMRVDATIAGKAFGEALENPGPAGRKMFNAYEEWCMTAAPAVTAAIEGMVVNPNLAGDAFEGGLGKFTASEHRAEQVAA